MLTLAVDTSTRTGSLAALRDREILGEISSLLQEPYSSRLFEELDRLLAQTRLSLREFDLFAVAAGPGSFTGLRVGLTAVKAWAEVYGRPVAAVSGLEAVATQAPAELGRQLALGQLLAPAIDARRGQVFGALYELIALEGIPEKGGEGTALRLVGDEAVMDADQFVEAVVEQAGGRPVEFISPAPEILEASLQRFRLCSSCVLEARSALAAWIGLLGYEKAARGELVEALKLDANYVRRCDAEVRWKGF